MSRELYLTLTIGLGTILFISGLALIIFVVRGKCEDYDENGTCSKRSSDPMSNTNSSIAYISGIILVSISGILIFLPVITNLFREWFGTRN